MELREGIIVRSQKYQENSKIITLVNSEGLATFLVRGAGNHKSRNFSYSQELTKIGYDFHNRSNAFNILTTGKVIDSFRGIKSDLNKLNDALLIIEATNQLGIHLSDFTTFYQFLDEILFLLDQNPYHPYYLLIFRVKLLYLLGIGPVFSKCVVCGSREHLIGFDFLKGGMKCSECNSDSSIYYNQEVIQLLRLLYLTKLENLSSEFLNKLPNLTLEATKFLDRYYEHFLGYQSRASRIIQKMKISEN
ncbi:MAG TPA: DNA repair protein RecO [Bacilli bacterium]